MEKLRVLHVEDNLDDALLVRRLLKKNGYDIEIRLVENSADLDSSLVTEEWDIVLSDYALPKFDGLTALKQVVKYDPDLPFILVSGAVGDETAVQIMKAGAKDFIMKDTLGRLIPAISRELVDSQVRKDKKRVEQQKRDLEKQLWQAQKMEAIGTLAGGIAHDFNNILTAIIGYSELALRDLADLPDTKRKIGEVVKAGNRAKDLVQHILTFSRKSEADRKAVDISHIVKETLILLRATIPSSIEFKENILIGCGKVQANSTRIHQVVLNLCTNASYAMAKNGGVLSVSLDTIQLALGELTGNDNVPGEYIRLTIQDTGEGVDPKIITKVFDPYFTTKPQGVGTGLGLSLVLGIIKSHAGYITVESNLGVGTIFTVYLPKIKNGFPKKGEDIEVKSVPVGGNEDILIVDDEEIITQFSGEILGSLGYNVTTAKDGVEALDIFRQHPDKFKLLVTDMTMPKMVGTELAQEILKIRSNLPIILCTGHSDQVNKEIANEVGIRAYCMKPLSGMELARIVRELLDDNLNN